MAELPANPGNEGQPRPDDVSTVRDSQAMLRGEQQDPLIGTTVGQYTIKRVIGSGGMGTVYEALQQSPRRTVALKMMKQGIASRNALRRFEYEAQTLGRLRHDNIAQIYEAGTHDDGTGARPFFAMEYLIGAKPLTTYAADKKFGTRERLELFSKVCDAVQHGHQKGIIHRDLKPPNILVTSSGVPKIIDFGVARSTDSDMAVTTLQTDVGALIGTLQYMSPEQCAADPNDIDTRSDVYALGVILYELLCDSLPYDLTRVAIAEAARIVQQEEPTKPSTVDKRLRGDVETIALKALEKDRDRRYQSATALEDDINRYLAGDPITAKAPSAIDYLRRFARKHKAAAISIAAIFVVLVGAVIAISIFAAEAQRERQESEHLTMVLFASEVALQDEVKKAEQAQAEAEQQANIAKQAQTEAEQQHDETRRQAYFGSIQAAQTAIKDLNTPALNRHVADAQLVMGSPPREDMPFEWQHLAARYEPLATFEGQSRRFVAFQPNGNRLVTADWSGTGNRGYVVQVLDANSGEELLQFQTGPFKPIQVSRDGSRLLVHEPRTGSQLWNLQTGKYVSHVGHTVPALAVDLSPNGDRVAAVKRKSNSIHVWDTNSGEEILEVEIDKAHTGLREAIDFSDDGQHIVVVTAEAVHAVHLNHSSPGPDAGSIPSVQPVVIPLQSQSNWSVPRVCQSPDGSRVAIKTDFPQGVEVVDVTSGDLVCTLSQQDVTALVFSSNGELLFVGDQDGTIQSWRVSTGELLGSTLAHEDAVGHLSISADGTLLASGSWDKSIKLWDTMALSEHSPAASEGILKPIAFSPDGRLMAHTSSGYNLEVWNSLTGELLADSSHAWPMYHGDAAFTADGRTLVTCGTQRSKEPGSNSKRQAVIRAWDPMTMEVRTALIAANAEYISFFLAHAINPKDSKTVFAICQFLSEEEDDGYSAWILQTWDLESGEQGNSLTELETGMGPTAIACSPTGNMVAISGIGRVDVLSTTSQNFGEVIATRRHSASSDAIEFSPDGHHLCWTEDNTILVAEVDDPAGVQLVNDDTSGTGPIRLEGHLENVESIAFSPDGQRLVSGGNDDTVRIWDIETGREMATLQARGSEQGHGGAESVAFSPDGSKLVAGGFNGLARTWDTRSPSRVEQLRRADRSRSEQFVTLMDTWMDKADGDNETMVALLAHEASDRSHEERVTLQNLVLNAIHERPNILRGHSLMGGIQSVAFSPDGRLLASASEDSSIRIWDVATQQEIAVMSVAILQSVLSVAFSPDGTQLASSSRDGNIDLWDLETGQRTLLESWLPSLPDQASWREQASARRLAGLELWLTFSPDGTRLAAGMFTPFCNIDGDVIHIWDVATHEKIATLPGNEGGSKAVAFSPDGMQLATAGCGNNEIQIWDVASGENVATLHGPTSYVETIAFNPDGTLLAAGSYGGDKPLCVWDLDSNNERYSLVEPEQHVISIAFSPDGTRLASTDGEAQSIRLWDVATGKEARVLQLPVYSPLSLAFNPVDGQLVAGDKGGVIHLWDERGLGQVRQDRRLARQRVAELAPLVDSWIEKANGDDELVVAMLNREVNDRTSEEATTLRNLVLKKLCEQRAAN